jgi:hypothetical protein
MRQRLRLPARLALAGAVVAVAVGLSSAEAADTILLGSQRVPPRLPYLGTPGIAARSVESFLSTFDSTTGVWQSDVSFYGSQSAAAQAKRYLTLGQSAPGAGSALVALWTNPAAPRPTYALSGGRPTGSTPSPVISTFFHGPTGNEVTITVTDPALIGKSFDTTSLRLSKGNVLYDELPPLTLTPGGINPFPRVTLPKADRQLRVTGNAIPVTIARIPLPISVAAFIEVHGIRVARFSTSLRDAIPKVFGPLALLPSARALLPRGRHVAGKLIVLAYRPTGPMEEASLPTTITTSPRT